MFLVSAGLFAASGELPGAAALRASTCVGLRFCRTTGEATVLDVEIQLTLGATVVMRRFYRESSGEQGR